MRRSPMELNEEPHGPQRFDFVLDARLHDARILGVQDLFLYRRPEDSIEQPPFEDDDPPPDTGLRPMGLSQAIRD